MRCDPSGPALAGWGCSRAVRVRPRGGTRARARTSAADRRVRGIHEPWRALGLTGPRRG